MVKAIETALSWNVDIISISMGTDIGNNDLRNVILNAVNHGIVIICSAGNDPYEANYPASFNIPGVISVGAIGNDYNILPYTNINPQIDIYAPGEDIASLINDNSKIIGYSGTSVSVPFITFACIYIKAYYSSLKPKEAENFLIKQTDTYLAKWRNEQREIKVLNMAKLMKSLSI
ncbi:S8 family serine peptidase [Mahella australiensis]|uniref:S8 family serine peptidase n=1 Tax=Mahella australiensis TaxID=252966 RepID=UPI0006744F66